MGPKEGFSSAFLLRLALVATLIPKDVLSLIDGVDPSQDGVGTRFSYGWAPENRPNSVMSEDDYTLLRMTDWNGTFQETITLYPHAENGRPFLVDMQGFGFKRYAIQSDPDYMVTFQVENKGKCAVYMASYAFSDQSNRDIRGVAPTAGEPFFAAVDETETYAQPYYRMNLGSTGEQNGIGTRAGRAYDDPASFNYFDTSQLDTGFGEPVYPDEFTFIEGKFVDGVRELPDLPSPVPTSFDSTQMSHIQYSRFPIGWDEAGECTEAPILGQKYMAIDIAHLFSTAMGVPATYFPGVYDDQLEFIDQCDIATAATVTITIRWVYTNLLKDFTVLPNVETPRRMPKALSVGENTHFVCGEYTGTLTITRAAEADEKYITNYIVYSAGQDITGLWHKCTGEPFLIFTKEECQQESATNDLVARTCSKIKVRHSRTRYLPDDGSDLLSTLTCNKFIVVTSNEAGEDDITQFYGYTSAANAPNDPNFPQIQEIPRVAGCQLKKGFGEVKKMDGEVYDDHSTWEPVGVESNGEPSVNDEDDEDYDSSDGAAQKHVSPNEYTLPAIERSDEVGSWYERYVEGILDDVYIHDIPSDSGSIYEDDDDLRPGGFNVPYHRWTFSPSQMSRWELTLANYNSPDIDMRYDATRRVGVEGFAVMPLDNYCIANTANGADFSSLDEIRERCNDNVHDDYVWYSMIDGYETNQNTSEADYDASVPNTATWEVMCNNQTNQRYQIIVPIRKGWRGRYNLHFRYKDDPDCDSASAAGPQDDDICSGSGQRISIKALYQAGFALPSNISFCALHVDNATAAP